MGALHLIETLSAEPAGFMHVASDERKKEEFKLPGWIVGRRFTKDQYKDETAYEDMVVARSILLKDRPFWGILAIGLVLIEDHDGILPTLATDGRHIIYNASFVRRLKKGELQYAIAHEILHCLYKHVGSMSRKYDRDDYLWNCAADYVINLELKNAGVGDVIETIKILLDDKFANMSAEEVYEFLVQNPDQIPQGAGPMDMHIEVEVVPDDEWEDGEGEGEGEGKPNKIKIKQSDFDKMDKQWKEQVVQAAAAQKEHDERNGNSAGSLPAFVQRLLEDLATPRINWKHALQRYVRAIIQRGYSYARPHRGTFHQGMTIPGFRKRSSELDICVCVDTSGSVSQAQLAVFLGELDGILQSFASFRVLAWCFEGEVAEKSITELKKHGAGTWDTIQKFLKKVEGGGGTDFMSNWEYMKKERIKPKLLLMLTDGYPVGSWGDPGYCPTMFFMMGNHERREAPFGITIHYEDEVEMQGG